MITGGAWEIALYPHCPRKYKPKDVDGIEHMLGLFDLDAHYEVFKTLRC